MLNKNKIIDEYLDKLIQTKSVNADLSIIEEHFENGFDSNTNTANNEDLRNAFLAGLNSYSIKQFDEWLNNYINETQ
jgi:hypothetical protein